MNPSEILIHGVGTPAPNLTVRQVKRLKSLSEYALSQRDKIRSHDNSGDSIEDICTNVLAWVNLIATDDCC